jgi:hypothetical protein
METIEHGHRVNTDVRGVPGVTADENIRGGRGPDADPPVAVFRRSIFVRWLLHDTLHNYVVVGDGGRHLPPAGKLLVHFDAGVWHHFGRRGIAPFRDAERYKLALCWCSVLLAIFLLYGRGVQGVLNANANSLAMMILLALGTFVAGVQASVWRICAVGGILFLAVPGLGWLDQSPLLLAAATLVIIALGGLTWWVSQFGGQGTGGKSEALLGKTAVA